ncbi:hypothetical protein SCHPADRAFT_1001312 [Schizopora paradoxa]|uniref:F-box domain-containing protein n=1 Tax=Schizopora paradoxa TaxID=27342 RepID=A0A0H2R981_9AGAM|nr:hypothetical protein SCHPADRAFT_1001312 [Schizopora paradoxa]
MTTKHHGMERIDRGVIQTLRNLLLRIEKLEGRLDDEECWNPSLEGVFAPQILAKSPPGPADEVLQQSLDGTEKLAAFIQRGLEIYGKRGEEAKPCLILEIPNEILTSIFHFACQVDNPPFKPRYTAESLSSTTAVHLSISATCRRFRNLLIANPAEWGIWQNIDIQKLKLFQERSQDKPLLVYIKAGFISHKLREEAKSESNEEFESKATKRLERLSAFQGAYKCIMQHRQRFRALAVELLDHGVPRRTALPELAQTSSWQGVSLPLLEELSVAYTVTHLDEHHFFETWVMPRLRSVSITNAIPKGQSCTALSASLVSLQLTFDCRPWPTTGLSLVDLVEFLGSMSSLLDLTLQFNSRINTMPLRGRHGLLQSLEALNLHLGFDDQVFAWDLLGVLKMPVLQSFVLSVDFNADRVQNTVASCLETNNRFAEIRSFELRVFGKAAMGTIVVRDIFCHLHSLRNLSIVAPTKPLDPKGDHIINFWRDSELDYGPSDQDGLFNITFVERLPPLENLRLCGNVFNLKIIEHIYDEYKRKEIPLMLKSLVLKNCRCFDDDLEALYRFIPPHNIICLDDFEGYEDNISNGET